MTTPVNGGANSGYVSDTESPSKENTDNAKRNLQQKVTSAYKQAAKGDSLPSSQRKYRVETPHYPGGARPKTTPFRSVLTGLEPSISASSASRLGGSGNPRCVRALLEEPNKQEIQQSAAPDLNALPTELLGNFLKQTLSGTSGGTSLQDALLGTLSQGLSSLGGKDTNSSSALTQLLQGVTGGGAAQGALSTLSQLLGGTGTQGTTGGTGGTTGGTGGTTGGTGGATGGTGGATAPTPGGTPPGGTSPGGTQPGGASQGTTGGQATTTLPITQQPTSSLETALLALQQQQQQQQQLLIQLLQQSISKPATGGTAAAPAATAAKPAVTNIATSLAGLSSFGVVGSAVGSVAALIYHAASSDVSRRGARFCYDRCHTCCGNNCGCPACGCPEGECGCGGIGQCLCAFWGNICGMDTTSKSNLEKELKELETQFGSAILLMSLHRLGLDTAGILSGNVTVTLPSTESIRNMCQECSANLPEILGKKHNEIWSSVAQSDYSSILRSPFWRGHVVKGLGSTGICEEDSVLKNRVLVVHPWFSGKDVASPFVMVKIGDALSGLDVYTPDDQYSKAKTLGVRACANVMNDLSKVLSSACSGGAPVWISVDELMQLVCLLLEIRGIRFVCGQNAYQPTEGLSKLTNEIEEYRRACSMLGSLGSRPSKVNSYVDVAAQCLLERAKRAAALRDMRNSPECMDRLMSECSRVWLSAAGIHPREREEVVVTQQPQPIAKSEEGASGGESEVDIEYLGTLSGLPVSKV